MIGRNISGRIFGLDHFLLGLVIIQGVLAATRVPPPTCIAKILSGSFNFFHVGISTFGYLVPPVSSRVWSGSCHFPRFQIFRLPYSSRDSCLGSALYCGTRSKQSRSCPALFCLEIDYFRLYVPFYGLPPACSWTRWVQPYHSPFRNSYFNQESIVLGPSDTRISFLESG